MNSREQEKVDPEVQSELRKFGEEIKKELTYASAGLLKELNDFISAPEFRKRNEHIEPILKSWPEPSDQETKSLSLDYEMAKFDIEKIKQAFSNLSTTSKRVSTYLNNFVEKTSELKPKEREETAKVVDTESNIAIAIQRLTAQLPKDMEKLTPKRGGQTEPLGRGGSVPAPTTEQDIRLIIGLISLVRSYTEIWSIYRIAWEQRRNSNEKINELFKVSDRTVRELYSVILNKNLDLEVEGQTILTVFFSSAAYTEPSREIQMPYIVIPAWASHHAWVGNTTAHEVGHHIYSNVKGLSNELLLKVMLTLIENRVSSDHLSVWGQWVEEIFADLFGLLQLGPAVIRSMQRVLTYATNDLGNDPKINLSRKFVSNLWKADDISHPVKQLRVWLSIEALRMLSENNECAQELDDLERRWDCISSEKGAKPRKQITLWLGSPLFIKRSKVVPYEQLQQEGKLVLDAILYTPLHALSSRVGADNQLRSVKDVFYCKPQYEQIKQVAKKLQEPLDEQFFQTIGDVRTIVAAAEYAFEETESSNLTELSECITDAIACLDK